nr:MAG TPA: hypothetical protein [Caudoviricetes sp.]
MYRIGSCSTIISQALTFTCLILGSLRFQLSYPYFV